MMANAFPLPLVAYDSNPFETNYSQNVSGRLAAK
jgi:hypothetical protein